jgi:hypothetical protein
MPVSHRPKPSVPGTPLAALRAGDLRRLAVGEESRTIVIEDSHEPILIPLG